MMPKKTTPTDAIVDTLTRDVEAITAPESVLLLTLVSLRRPVEVNFEALFQQAINAVRPDAQTLTLVGPDGLGALLMLQNALIAYGAELDICETTDENLGEFVATQTSAQFDVFNGIAGRLTYLLERPRTSTNEQTLQVLLDQLLSLAKHDKNGSYWALELPPLLGLAHGTAGVVSALASVISAGRDRPSERKLLISATEWLLANKSSTLAPFEFPIEVGGSQARLAWCHCDLGIAAGLIKAARALKRADWELEARTLSRRLSAISIEAGKMTEAGLCHGAGGVAVIFDYLAVHLGEEGLRRAAQAWFATANALWLLTPEDSFLTGKHGAALALELGATGSTRDWPRYLMLL